MALSLVATTPVWAAPASLDEAVTMDEVRNDSNFAQQRLNEVRTDAKKDFQINPQDQLNKYEYDVNGSTVKPDGSDSSFEYEYNGTTTNLGDKPSLDGTDYKMTGQNGKNYTAADTEIPQTDYSYDKSGTTVDLTTNVNPADYTYTDHNGVTQNITNKPNVTKYEYKDSKGNTHTLQLNENGVLVVPDGVEEDTTAMTNASVALQNYATDAIAYNTAAGQYNQDLNNYNDAMNDYTADSDTLKGLKDQYASDKKGFDNAVASKNGYDTDARLYATYDGTLSQIIDNKAETIAKQTVSDAINGELGELDGIVGKVGANTDALDVLNGDVDMSGSVQHTVYNESQNGKYDGAKVANSNAITLGEALEDTTLQVIKNTTNIAKNTDAIDVLNGDVNTVGSVKHTVYNEAQNGKYDGQKLNGSNATTLGGALSDTIGQVNTNTDSINTLNGDVNTAGSVQYTVYNNAENAVYTGTQVAGASTRATATLGSALSATIEQVNVNTVNIAQNATNIETNRQNIASNLVKIEQNRTNISQLRNDFEAQNVRNEARFSQVEKEIEEVSDEMHKGLASTAALTSLVPLSSRHRTQLSLGMGGYRDKQAIAAGGYHYLAGNVLLNAGVSWGGDDSVSYKAGVTYGF